MKRYIFALAVLASSSSFAGGTDVGSAQHFYSREQSGSLTKFAMAVHEKYGLYVTKLKEHSETYVGAYNIDKMKLGGSDVTAYSDLTFMKSGDHFQMYYNTPATNRPVIIELDTENNAVITSLLSDMTAYADYVGIDGAASYGRGGSHLSAQNLAGVVRITLSCQTVVYSDGSGGDSCLTKTSGINFSDKKTKVMVGPEQIEVPKKFLKTWADAYWNKKF